MASIDSKKVDSRGMSLVALDGLTKRYPGGVTALDGLTLSIARGSFWAVMGPSGSGKTTTGRAIAARLGIPYVELDAVHRLALDTALAGWVRNESGEVFLEIEGPPDSLEDFLTRLSAAMIQVLTTPYPTVAAVNGHAFAGGAFVAMSCDYRIMREDRGWICVSEVDAGVPLPDSMMNLLRGKVPPATARDAILTGKRYAADEAIAAGFADGKAPMEGLLGAAKALASNLATKDPGIFKLIKQNYFGSMAAGLQPEI